MTIPNFNQRLRETISWCLAQEITSAPEEDERITRRRMTNRRGAELIGRAYGMLAPYEHASWISRWSAKEKIRRATETRRGGEQLMAAADAGSIVPPLRNQLRSETLRPFAQSFAQSGADQAAIVDQVAEARTKALSQSGKGWDSQSPYLRDGRLLLYAPEENLADGTAEYVSFGFFDVDNVPPWDTG